MEELYTPKTSVVTTVEFKGQPDEKVRTKKCPSVVTTVEFKA